MKGNQYGFCGQATFRNAKAILFMKLGKACNIFHFGYNKISIFFNGGLHGVVGLRAPASIHEEGEFLGGGLMSTMLFGAL